MVPSFSQGDNRGFNGFSTTTTYPVGGQIPAQLMVFFAEKFRNLSLCKTGDFLIIFALKFSAQKRAF
jgi:hypothetical protein